jgi:hypothetical protein
VAFVGTHAERLAESLGEEAVAAYASDMGDASAWGGAVEVDVFSQLFGAVITVLDVENCTEAVFGAQRAPQPLPPPQLVGGSAALATSSTVAEATTAAVAAAAPEPASKASVPAVAVAAVPAAVTLAAAIPAVAAPAAAVATIQAFFLFSGGNHYDLLVWQPAPGAAEVLTFSSRDDTAGRRARRAASTLSTSKEWRVDGVKQNVTMLRQQSWE